MQHWKVPNICKYCDHINILHLQHTLFLRLLIAKSFHVEANDYLISKFRKLDLD